MRAAPKGINMQIMLDQHSVSNQVFLDAIFSNLATDSYIWVCDVKGDPTGKGGAAWAGEICTGGKLASKFDRFKDRNLYFVISALKADEQGRGRRAPTLVRSMSSY